MAKDNPSSTVRRLRAIKWAQSLGFRLGQMSDLLSIGPSHLRGRRTRVRALVRTKLTELVGISTRDRAGKSANDETDPLESDSGHVEASSGERGVGAAARRADSFGADPVVLVVVDDLHALGEYLGRQPVFAHWKVYPLTVQRPRT